MKKLQDEGNTSLGSLVEALDRKLQAYLCRRCRVQLERDGDTQRTAFETAWTLCFEIVEQIKAVYPSLRVCYKAEEPGWNSMRRTMPTVGVFPKWKLTASLMKYLQRTRNKG